MSSTDLEDLNREPQEPPRFKKDGWKYEYAQMLPQVQEEIAKPFEEKLKRTKQLIKIFATRDNASVACSFGKDSLLVLDLCLQVNPKIRVNFNNTLVEFVETMKLKDALKDAWDLNLHELHPAAGVTFYSINDRIIKKHQRLDQGRKHANQCCYGLKERPFILWARKQGIRFNFTGVTAMESRNRTWMACSKGQEYFDLKMGVWKMHPILYWTEEEVWNYTKDNHLPINEAYAKFGINRIGCKPCMSYKNWRPTLARICPKLCDFVCNRYCPQKTIGNNAYYEQEQEIYA